jgi:hypothetical protein
MLNLSVGLVSEIFFERMALIIIYVLFANQSKTLDTSREWDVAGIPLHR